MDRLVELTPAGSAPPTIEVASTYPPVQGLLNRRWCRIVKGMRLKGRSLAFASVHTPQPLSLEEEAALVYGVTGY